MGIIFDVPEYPVIDPSPRMWTTMKNYGWKEYAAIIGFPLVSAPFGYNWGAPHLCTCSVDPRLQTPCGRHNLEAPVPGYATSVRQKKAIVLHGNRQGTCALAAPPCSTAC